MQNGTFLCDRCKTLDAQYLLSSTRQNPWRPWRVADVVASAAAGCTFCCLLVDTLQLVHDKQDRNGTFADKALSILSQSKTAARFFADKVERMQRERDGWITFFVPEGPRDSQHIDEHLPEGITRIVIAVKGSKQTDSNREAEFILAPGPEIPGNTGSELPSLFPKGTLLRNTSQTLTELATSIQTWRQHCHDSHECWKPLAKRRNRKAEYVTVGGGGELTRFDWYHGSSPGNQVYYTKSELPPLELENGHLDSVALPSRCLEIVPGEDGQCWFWLRETVGEVGKYVILSHRWVADTVRVRTLKSNYEVRVSGFDDSDVPPIAPENVTKVFQEVSILILLCQSIPHLLCIPIFRARHFRNCSR
jgi:hypothetical protein